VEVPFGMPTVVTTPGRRQGRTAPQAVEIASYGEELVRLIPPRLLSLEQALEFIREG